MSEIDLKPKSKLLQWSEEDVAAILEQYNRKPDDLKADVAIIRDWLKTQPHLPLQPSDWQIVYFLILNKFSFEKTKTKLEMNYTIKSLIPEFVAIPPNDPRMEIITDAYIFVPLPQLSKKRNRILISKCQNPDIFDSHQFCNKMALLYELRTIYDFSNSDDYIIDCQNVNLSLISKINIVEVKRCVSLWEKVYSCRIGVIHVIRLPKFAESLANFMISLVKDKIRERIYFHKSVEGLWEFYQKDILPKEMGGTKPLEKMNKDWLELIRENHEYLEKIQNARIVERLRPQKLENDEILGYHGNFRKLEID